MRTGIKTLARKTISQIRYSRVFHRGISPYMFPKTPTPTGQIKKIIAALKKELQERTIQYDVGSLYTVPHPAATDIYKTFIVDNPSNLGGWADDISNTHGTTRFEHDVIHAMIDLYHGNHKTISGYITSGGTEGNIFAVWLGRTQLEKNIPHDKICLMTTSLTHYSASKAGRVCSVKQYLTPLNETFWNMDVQGFHETVRNLYKEGYRGFMVPLTLGYTTTGTSDDIDAICIEAARCEKEFQGIRFFFWIDAALNGLIQPFIKPSFSPFRSHYIQACIVDFHKLGGVPYPAGIVLYTKALKKNISRAIEYLPETDETLLGSRSGIPALSIWTMMHTLGFSGYAKRIREEMQSKLFFMTNMQRVSPDTEIITAPDSLTCGLIFRGLKHHRLPSRIETTYSLYPGTIPLLVYPNTKKEEIIYKCFFLPHMTKVGITAFIEDIKHL